MSEGAVFDIDPTASISESLRPIGVALQMLLKSGAQRRRQNRHDDDETVGLSRHPIGGAQAQAMTTPRAMAAAVLGARSRAEAARLLAEAPPAIAEIARTHINVTRARRHHDAETGGNRNFPAYRP